MKAIDRAIELVGLQALAAGCGVKYQAVQKWRKSVPPGRAGRIEELTQGRVTRRELCPDFAWEPSAADAATAPQESAHA